MELATFAIKDRPSLWTPNVLEAPPTFDIKSYQQKLTQIAGKTQQGEPVLRLVWGGSEGKTKAVKWDEFGNPLEYRKVPRYAFESKKMETWAQLVAIRRWFIEENTDAGQIEAMDGKRGANIEVPEKGFYTPYILVADHSKCPKDCKASEFKCFGDYKAPDNAELLFLTEVTYKLISSRKQDPRLGLDLDLVAEIIASETPNAIEQEALEDQENRKYVKSWLKTHKTIYST